MEHRATHSNQARKLGRRELLKTVGLASAAGIVLPPTLLKATENSDANELDEQIANLNDEEKDALSELLAILKSFEPPKELSPQVVTGCLMGVVWLQGNLDEKAEQQIKLQEQYQKKASLSGQAKVDYIVGLIKGVFGVHGDECVCMTSYQREILKAVTNGRTAIDDDVEGREGVTKVYIQRVSVCLDDCSYNIRKRAIRQYLDNVLPKLETAEQEQDEHDKAIEELLGLTNGKTGEQIKAMKKHLQATGV